MLLVSVVSPTHVLKSGESYARSAKITVINKGGYVFNYSVQWLGSDGRWVTSTWNSGNYPVAQSVTTPPLETIGVPADALAVTVYGHAVLGSSGQGTPFVGMPPMTRSPPTKRWAPPSLVLPST